MSRILLVEDDENLRVVLADNLEQEGYEVVEAVDGGSALAAVARDRFDLIVLDVMLPGLDGYEVCRRLRADKVPSLILMLTARTLEDDLVRGLDAGADDYVVKPYRLRELMARVRALLRRAAAGSPRSLRCGPYQVDVRARQVRDASGAVVHLTRTEFDLLCFLLRNEGRAVTRDEILDEVWSRDVVVDDRTVDNFIHSLKKKLRWGPGAGFRVRTVRGVGYRMDLERP